MIEQKRRVELKVIQSDDSIASSVLYLRWREAKKSECEATGNMVREMNLDFKVEDAIRHRMEAATDTNQRGKE